MDDIAPADGKSRSHQQVVWDHFANKLLDETLRQHPYWRAARDPTALWAFLSPSAEAELIERCVWGISERYKLLKDASIDFSSSQFLHAWLLVISRSFNLNGSRTTLVPGMDFFNHHPKLANAKVRWSDEDGGMMLLEASETITPGSEVYISYGDLCNPALFRTYGFTLACEEEPGHTFLILPTDPQVRSLLQKHLTGTSALRVLELDSRKLHETMVKAMKSCNTTGEGNTSARDRAIAFLEELFDFFWRRYQQDLLLKPILQNVDARADVSADKLIQVIDGRHPEDSPRLRTSLDSIRLRLSEYLCISIHAKALETIKKQQEPAVSGEFGLLAELKTELDALR
eukprot:TRINITY_DN79293_c0_g1_i1.p1 TRINITY_DN79293_c0_g1~~TRINITY_DN79293_c0_g1_i1.p1  ORF type:complete len:371 (+),score=47.38 TRINITY_DN79293_c0_g1_i1:82-1113(+)